MIDSPDISIIIPTKDRHELMLRTVDQVGAQIPLHVKSEMIVIEEAERPHPVEKKGVRYVHLPRRGWGFGYVRNLGLKEARGAIVVFLDDDVIPSEDWFETLLSPFKDESVGGVGGAILPDVSAIHRVGKCISLLGFPAGGPTRYLQAGGTIQETALISTGNCAFRADLAREIGGFDELLRWGGEDQEFFSRLSRVSKTLFVPDAVVYHRQRDSYKEVFSWFVRRGKADFFVKCKNSHPLHALLLPWRSNFWVKLSGFLLFASMLSEISFLAVVGFTLVVLIAWNGVLWRRAKRLLGEAGRRDLPLEIRQVLDKIGSGGVKWILFSVKLAMDMGHELGRFLGVLRYLTHRIFCKPLVVTFHHLSPSGADPEGANSRYYSHREALEELIVGSQRQGRRIVSLAEVVKRLQESPRSLYFEKVLSITFDDGYVSIYEPLRQILGRYACPLTIFVPTALMGDGNRWDEAKGLDTEKIMSWQQIKTLNKQGADIGSHTRTHVDLREVDVEMRRREIEGSLEDIKQHIPCGWARHILFSYPYGAYDQRVLRLVKEAGYRGAVANFRGNVRPKTDPWQIPRFTIHAGDDWESICKQSRSLWAKELLKDFRDWLWV